MQLSFRLLSRPLWIVLEQGEIELKEVNRRISLEVSPLNFLSLSRQRSWEHGTFANALLEFDAATWAPFAKKQYTEDAPFDILRFGVRAVVNQDSIGRLVSQKERESPVLPKIVTDSIKFFMAIFFFF